MENGVVKQGRTLIILSLLSLMCFSCGQSVKGYGVVLWSTDEKLYHAGDIVSVIEDSTVRNSYTFKAPETGDKVETPKFRLMYFKKKKAAADWAKAFEPWKSQFAMARKDGLAVRSAPDQNADRVYKLRLNEVMKVLSKAEKKAAIGDYSGYWYEVLTEAGVKGYCFDLNIEVYDGNKGIPEQNDPVMAVVDKALSKDYRPSSFGEMIREGRIDLVLFNPERGFFPDPEAKTIRVVLEDGSLSFSYTGITPVSSGVYAFDGSTAQLSVISDTDIALRYSSNNKEYVQNFTYIEDMELVIQQERERRQNLLADFTSRFRSLASSAYGNIRFGDDGSFTWENFSRLKPDIIPQTAAEKGTIQFFVFLSKELKDSHSGVISFHFENTRPDDFTHFLYSYTDRGVRFVSMPQRLIKDRVVLKENPSPIVISFSSGH